MAAGSDVGSVLLVAVTTRSPDDLPEGSLGIPRVIESAATIDAHVVVVDTEVEWETAPTDSLEWLAPRAIHFDDVMRSCTDAGALPFRFGSAFSDDAAVLAHLDARSEAISAELERLDNVREYRLAVSIERSDPESASSGADYLRRRRSETRDGSAVLDDLRERLQVMCTSTHIASIAETRLAMSVLCTAAQWVEVTSALVESSATAEYEGPLPPYHFVRLDE